MENQDKKVKVYYCQCDKSIVCAADPDLFNGNDSNARALRKEFKQASEWGLKVETITLEQFHVTPFMCEGIDNCSRKKEMA